MDSEKHREVTGVSNEPIHNNARKIAAKGKKMRLRLPIIPGINQEVEFIEEVAKFARELGDAVEGIDILPFHSWAEGKYKQLDKRYAFEGVQSLFPEDVNHLKKIFESYGFETIVGG
jgi:pyruvate formate lyase activating enzyme